MTNGAGVTLTPLERCFDEAGVANDREIGGADSGCVDPTDVDVGGMTECLGLRGELKALFELGSGPLRRGDLNALDPLLMFRFRRPAGENDGGGEAVTGGREKARGDGVAGVLPKFFIVRKAGRSGEK